MERNAILEVIEKFGNDIRQILNFMQMWKRSRNEMKYDDIMSQFHNMEKDKSLRLNPFDATMQIFGRETTFGDRFEAYFVDYDLMPLMVQENYITSIRSSKDSVDKMLEAAVHASEYISEADIISQRVRATMVRIF